MNRLRNRLILVFLAATLAPLAVTLWVTTRLLEHSLDIASSREAELDLISKSLETTGRALYKEAGEDLKKDAVAGRTAAQLYDRDGEPVPPRAADRQMVVPAAIVREFWENGEPERFVLSGSEGNQLHYLVRRDGGVAAYGASLGGVGLERLSAQIRDARKSIEAGRAGNLRRGFTYTYVVLAAGIWIATFSLLVFLAHRISRPIQRLTAGLSELASGNLAARVPRHRDDEVGRAIQAFNHMAGQLQQNRDRLVYLTQLASWQSLARKMAHEVKNSLTPIRLTVEEMLARRDEKDSAFLEQAAQIVVDEVESLERRIRAFSEFAAEPPIRPMEISINTLLQERVAFLKTGHPEISYDLRLFSNGVGQERLCAYADEDLVKGVLTNLLENAAEAAGSGGTILAATASVDSKVTIEIHDSGPGLSDQARRSLFQPTISFKKRGMGLGLSIARKSALLLGGDILSIEGELGGAAFRVLLPGSEDKRKT